MARRPDDFEFAIPDFDHIVIIDELVGIGNRTVHRGSHPRRSHPGWRELLNRKSVARKERSRFGTIVWAHFPELDHPARALSLEAMDVRDRMTAPANLARRAEVIDMVMRRDQRVEILDLDSNFRERFFQRGDALRRMHPRV